MKMIKHILWWLFPLMILAFSGCIDNVDQDQIDEEKIAAYIKDNNLQAVKHEVGFYYIIKETGGTAKPTNISNVKVHYVGSLTDNSVFDSSYARGVPLEVNLGGVILGWQFGIPLFGKEGKGTLILPSRYGYGSRSINQIPANSVLVFEVHLIDFN